jgi:pyruvate dehydrogenase phosphatase
MLYTDWVDNIIHGCFFFRSHNPSIHPLAAVMGALLGETVDQEFMRDVFDHEVELKWNGSGGNRTVELLGNVLGGNDASRFLQVLDTTRLSVGNEDEVDPYVDDPTSIVCPLNKQQVYLLHRVNPG